MQTSALPPRPRRRLRSRRQRRVFETPARVFWPFRRYVPGFRAGPRRLQLRDQPSRRHQARAAVEPPQLHQGRGHGSRQDSARQRHHDQRRGLLAQTAAHDAALVSPPRHRSVRRPDRRGQRQVLRALGRERSPRRTHQSDRRCERIDPGHRAALHLRQRSYAPRKAARGESFRSRRQGTEPRPQVRIPFSLADQAGGRIDRPPPQKPRGTLRFPEHAHGDPGPRDGPAHERQGIDRRGVDADRGGSRDHRRRAYVDLVSRQPARGSPGSPGAGSRPARPSIAP